MRVFRFTKGWVSVYAVESEGEFLLVDTGLPGQGEWLLEKLRSKNLYPGKCAGIVLTHHHFDHAGNLAFFHRYVEEEHNKWLKVYAGFGESVFVMRGLSQLPKPLTPWARVLVSAAGDGRFPPFDGELTLVEDEMEVKLGGETLKIKRFGGHTEGSICLFAPDGRAFVGDLFMNGLPFSRVPVVSVLGISDEEMKRAVGKFLAYFTSGKVYPAHHREFSLSELRLRYKI